jgi:mannose-6-phosphate isomerase-like protein (cupin superfamily)
MMKSSFIAPFLAGAALTAVIFGFARSQDQGYILVHEQEIAVEQPGPHKGGGVTVAFPFFEKAAGLKMAFRKRILRPGSSIGYHLQESDEIYYVLEGTGTMSMNGSTFPVKKGDAILTRPGSSHGIRPAGADSLVMLICYDK